MQYALIISNWNTCTLFLHFILDYEENHNYFGVLCGRVANRIGNAEMTIDGTTYKVSQNDSLGGHFVHGGFVGFSRVGARSCRC